MSTNLTNESLGEASPRRKGRIRRVLKRAFYLVLILIGVFAIYAWATGARQEPIETGEPHMKAVVYTDYGSPDVLQIRDIKKPVPNHALHHARDGGWPAQTKGPATRR
jgi:hypothetical protein